MDRITEYLKDPGWNTPPEIEEFLNGSCHLFAVCVHRLTGWQILAFSEPRIIDGLPDDDFIRPGLVHAMCLIPGQENKVFDAKGERHIDDIVLEYGILENCTHEIVNESTLYNLVFPGKQIDETELVAVQNFIKQYYATKINSLNMEIKK